MSKSNKASISYYMIYYIYISSFILIIDRETGYILYDNIVNTPVIFMIEVVKSGSFC